MKIVTYKRPMDVKYSDLSVLAPKEYPKVSVYNKETKQYEDKKVYRKYMSYGVSPKFKDTGKSYMFNNQSEDMPVVIKELLEFAQRFYDRRLNNVYVNWYKDGEDYIEPHSDCIDSLVEDSPILIINFNEGSYCRTLMVQHKVNDLDYEEITLKNNLVILMDSKQQAEYRHWVNKEDTDQGRISVTFRAIKENNE